MASLIQLPDTCSNFYELLGLKPFEPDSRAIDAKVRERMREARKYQVGQFAEQAQKHLDLLAEASACLLNVDRKEEYDELLRRQYDLPPVSVSSTFEAGMHGSPPPLAQPQPLIPASERPPALARSSRRRRRVLAVSAAAITLGIIGYAISHSESLQIVTYFHAVVPESRPIANGNPADPAATLGGGSASGSPSISPSTEEKQAPATDHSPDPIAASPVTLSEPADESAAADDASDPPIIATKTKSGTQPATPPHSPPAVDTPPGRVAKSTPAARPIVESAPTRVAVVEEDLHLTPVEVLRELKLLRLNRSANSKLPPDIVTPGWQRAERLVRYGMSAHHDDKRFLKQLKQEIVAQKKFFPRLVEVLRDIAE